MRRVANARIGRTVRRLAAAGALALAAGGAIATPAAAQEARIINADLRTVPASSSLASQLRTLIDQQTEPAWIGYVEPAVNPRMNSCCYTNDNGRTAGCGGCFLEPRDEGTRIAGGSAAPQPGGGGTSGPIKLEGTGQFVVLVRVEQKAIERLRVFSSDCELDAGGRRVTMVTGVTPAASIAWLESLVEEQTRDPLAAGGRRTDRDRDRSRLADGAVTAIAFHRAPEADAALDRFVAPARPAELRRKALFWLASARGAHGFDVVQRLVKDDPDATVRKHAVFALTVSKQPGATPALLDAARHSPFTEVRAEAIFWTAQVAGRKAAETITEAIEQDPETEVKKKAVFALSQLPNHEGVPMLIDVARKNRNPAVRKQAMFWLGQSKDPRALDFFESILK